MAFALPGRARVRGAVATLHQRGPTRTGACYRRAMPTNDAPAALGEADVRHVAKLARLRLTDDEVTRMTAELTAIVAYVQQLSELDVTGVPPTTQVQVERLPLRPDEPGASLDHDLALREAPRAASDGFAVPAFVEE